MLRTNEFTVDFKHHVPITVEVETHIVDQPPSKMVYEDREATMCQIEYGLPSREAHEETTLHTGFAIVNPVDGYSRPLGRKLALSHALFNSPREIRTAVWAAYWANREAHGQPKC